MLRRILMTIVAGALSITCLEGCKKQSSPPEPNAEAVKTQADYKTEAAEQINEQNMEQELAKMEKEVAEETAATQ